MSKDARTLAQRLADAEATVAALLAGQIDAVFDAKSNTPVLLYEAQAALRESEVRYRRIVETTNEGILTVDRLSTITFVNRRVTEILGFSSTEMMGTSLFRYVSAGAAVLPALRAADAEGKADYSVSFRRSDGDVLWTLLKASAIGDANGQHVGTLLMISDRTRQKRDEEALLEDAKEHRQVIELAPVGILKIDAAGAIAFANPRFGELIGYAHRELIGADVTTFMGGEARLLLRELLCRRVLTPIGATLRHKDGTMVPVHVTSNAMVNDAGGCVATLAFIHAV